MLLVAQQYNHKDHNLDRSSFKHFKRLTSNHEGLNQDEVQRISKNPSQLIIGSWKLWREFCWLYKNQWRQSHERGPHTDVGSYLNLDVGLKLDARIVFQRKCWLYQAGDTKVIFNTKRNSRTDHQNEDLSSVWGENLKVCIAKFSWINKKLEQLKISITRERRHSSSDLLFV